jgi:hypothetical protein
MEDNSDTHEVRLHIESLTNFLKKPKEAETKQLGEPSKGLVVGDPLTAKINQMVDYQGSDKDNSPTVSVKIGPAKGGSGFETGQHKAQFSDKTELAEKFEISEEKLRALIVKVLEEQMDATIREEETVAEAVSDELLGEPLENNESVEESGGRSHVVGCGNNLKPGNYPKNLKR